MKKIVLSAIIALVAMVGVYQIALLAGASQQEAAFVVTAFAFAFAFAFAAFAAVAAVVTAVAAADELKVPYRWAFAAFAVEVVTIFVALTVGSTLWSVAIFASGVVAIGGLWSWYVRRQRPAVVASAPVEVH